MNAFTDGELIAIKAQDTCDICELAINNFINSADEIVDGFH